jgi:hypothetical protein
MIELKFASGRAGRNYALMACIAAALAASAPSFTQSAYAQGKRYIEWRQQDNSPKALIDEIRRIIDRAEAERAADPLLFQDLRGAIRNYESQSNGVSSSRPIMTPPASSSVTAPSAPTAPSDPRKQSVRVTVLKDNFADGDYLTNPAWKAHEGRFWVDGQRGLRSRAFVTRSEKAIQLPRVSINNVVRPEHAISSGDRHRSLARAMAFDADPQTAWESALEGRAIEGKAYIGQDFGRGNEHHISRVFIRQNSAGINGNAYNLDVQRWDATGWQTVQSFTGSTDGSRQALDLPRSARSERWRVVANAVIVSAPRAHWQVTELEMEEIDQPWRIAKAPPPPKPEPQAKAEPASNRGLGGFLGGKPTMGQIGGAIVNELVRSQTGGTQPTPAPQAKVPAAAPQPPAIASAQPAPLPTPAPVKTETIASRAEISTSALIGNDFTIRTELASLEGRGRIIIGPYQRNGRSDGYRLAYSPAGRPWLALLRLSRQGVTTIDSIDRPAAGDSGEPRVLSWSRQRNGVMTVSIDGHIALRASDWSFRDSFTGVSIVNEGGDFILGEIAIEGSR